MSERITRLYPGPTTDVGHQGRYLADTLIPTGHSGPFIYTNFVTSLDGRIALNEGPDAGRAVPRAIANPRDWRLFQELAGRADLLITSGRYLRDLGAGTAQDVLPVGTDPAFHDIHQWRNDSGLAPQPDVLVISASLAFPPPWRLIEQGRHVTVLTSNRADANAASAVEEAGAEVIRVDHDNGQVTGEDVYELTAARSYRAVYSVTGPDVLATLAQSGALHALFLTTVHCMLSGRDYSSITRGDVLSPPLDLTLTSLYMDSEAPDGVGQTFARYDRRAGGRPYR